DRMLDTFGAVVGTGGGVATDGAKVSTKDFPLVDGGQQRRQGSQGSTQSTYATEVSTGDVLQILARGAAAQTTPNYVEPEGHGRMLDTFCVEPSTDGNAVTDGVQLSMDDSLLIDGDQKSMKRAGAHPLGGPARWLIMETNAGLAKCLGDAWMQQQVRGVRQPFKKEGDFPDTGNDVIAGLCWVQYGPTMLASVRGPRRGRCHTMCGWIDHRSQPAQVGLTVQRLVPEGFKCLCPCCRSRFKGDTLAVDGEPQLEHATAGHRDFYFLDGEQ
ncbi:unnamed protein product, partial [Prorocentrum cordatum]